MKRGASSSSPLEKRKRRDLDEIDVKRAIDTIRVLSADIVEKANSGHPGAPMGCAPLGMYAFSSFVIYIFKYYSYAIS